MTSEARNEGSPQTTGSARYPVFTVPQIRHYLTGGIFTRGDDPDGVNLPENTALAEFAAHIEAMRARMAKNGARIGLECVTGQKAGQDKGKVAKSKPGAIASEKQANQANGCILVQD